MKTASKHLNDEHMQMYEWSGLGAVATGTVPAGAKRTHAWHASYGVLAVLTTLLILNGCDAQKAAEQTSEQVGQAAEDTADPRLFDDTAPEAAAPAAEAPSEPPPVGEAAGEAAGGGGAAPAGAPEQP